MKTLITISIFILALSACQKDYDRCIYGDSYHIQELQPLHRIDKIEISGEVTVELRQGIRDEIFFDMPENYLRYFYIDQRNRTLKISKDRCLLDNYLIVITVRDLEEIELSDRALLVIPEQLRVRNLDIYMEDDSEIDAAFSVDKLNLEMRESSYAKLFGEVLEVEIERYGDGTIDALDMTADFAEILHHGSNDINVHVLQHLDVDIHSSGSIFYLGDPDVTYDITGTGALVDIN